MKLGGCKTTLTWHGIPFRADFIMPNLVKSRLGSRAVPARCVGFSCHAASVAPATSSMENIEGIEDISFDDEDDLELLPCSFKYLRVCILLPAVNGLLNAFLWPAYAIHFDKMDWPLIHAGAAVSVGFASRVVLQHLLVRTGYWLVVPLSAIHLIVVVWALIFRANQWAVLFQIVVWLGIDPTCAIEGIAFDSFSDSEVQARQATSTVLSVFTIAFAVSCAFGGMLLGLSGWRGMTVYHVSLQSLILLLLACEPACWDSFMAVFFKSQSQMEPKQPETKGRSPALVQVVPTPKEVTVLPGAVDELQLEDVEEAEAIEQKPQQTADGNAKGRLTVMTPLSFQSNESFQLVRRWEPRRKSQARQSRFSSRTKNSKDSKESNESKTTDVTPQSFQSNDPLYLVRRQARQSQFSEAKNSNETKAMDEKTQGRLERAKCRRSVFTTFTSQTKQTGRSGRTAFTALSSLSQLSVLSEAGRHFQNHFAASRSVLPKIVGATGEDSVLREELHVIDETGSVVSNQMQHTTSRIPSDIRLPAALIALNSFCNTCAYILEYATFAIYFKEVYKWKGGANLVGITQMAGDVLGALLMQLIPVLFRQTSAPDNLGFCGWLWHCLLSKPYGLSITLFTWILLNLAMVTPWLPVAFVAQVLMGATFAYSCKWSTDMNLLYSFGSSQVFLSLEVLCRNAEAAGGSLAGILAIWLYSFNKAAPFLFGALLACTIFLAYTIGFCLRAGFGDELESTEQKRRRLEVESLDETDQP